MVSFILPGNSATGGFDVANSLRFNDGSSDYLNRTLSGSGNTKKFTISFWQKLGTGFSADRAVISGGADANNYLIVRNSSSQTIQILETVSGSDHTNLVTNRLFRDVSAWYHIVVAIDTTQGTDTNRVKLYVNGTQETSFSTATYPGQNDDLQFNNNTAHAIGRRQPQGNIYMDGYLAEFVFVDNQQLAPDQFGEFDEDSGIWKPKNVSGLTFGTNGFYLDFEDSSALGNDKAGSNNFTVNNLTAIDQATDTCMNNYAVLNPLDNYYASSTFSEGNCKIVTSSGNMSYNTGTIAVSQGKWYVEAKVVDNADSNYHHFGIAETPSTSTSNWLGVSATHYGLTGYDGKIWRNNSGTAYGVSTTTGDIVGMYIDLDNNKLYFAKNGTVMNSGTGISITAAASTTNGYYLISYGDLENASTATWEVNFGSPTYSVSSSNTDDNGYGNFEYSPNITGDGAAKKFYALNTKNLAEYG